MQNGNILELKHLPKRAGSRPTTTNHAPHSQTNQLPDMPTRQRLSHILIDALSTLPDVTKGGSRRAPYGSVGFYVDSCAAKNNERCFLLGHEFAHVHLLDDGSLHAILAEPLRTQAIDAGWAEPHPFAGQPTVSPDTVMIYTPRSEEEAEIIIALTQQSWKNAHQ